MFDFSGCGLGAMMCRPSSRLCYVFNVSHVYYRRSCDVAGVVLVVVFRCLVVSALNVVQSNVDASCRSLSIFAMQCVHCVCDA